MRPSANRALSSCLLTFALVVPFRTLLAADSGDPRIPFKRYRLENGLEVILHQDRTVPIVHVNVWYHVGSGDETPGKSGFAHLFEHMMFQGTKNTGEDQHFGILQEIGAQDANGSTNPNRTNYYETVPANQLETALWLESERMGYLLDAVSEKSLANQREVVRNERRQNYDNVPYSVARFAVNTALYPEGHPYRHLTIGRHEDLEAASLDDVQGFFRRWYVPANATLAVAGDFETAEAERLIAKWFATFPKTTKPLQAAIPAPAVQGPVRLEVADPLARLRRVQYAWHTPPVFSAGDAELDLLASALGNPGTGTLYKTLVLEKQVASDVQVFQGSLQMSSAFHVLVDLLDHADLAEIENIVLAEVARVGKTHISERELRRGITAFETAYVWNLEPILARAEHLQTYNHFLADPHKLTWDLDRYRNATVEGVRAAAARFLGAKGRVEVVTVPAPALASTTATAAPTPPQPTPPEAGGPAGAAVDSVAVAVVFPQEEFRKHQPAAAAARAFSPPTVANFSLPNGLAVLLVNRDQVPTIAMQFVFPGGSGDDPLGKEGAASLCTDLLDDGTETLDKVALEERLADLGSVLTAAATVDQQTLTANTLRKNLDATLDLLADAILHPGLRATDHERNIATETAALREAKGTPAALSRRLVGPVLYGDNSPAARIPTEASLAAVTPADCRAHLSRFLRPQGAKLFVAGDIDRGEIEDKLGPRLLAWQGSAQPGSPVLEPRPRTGRLFFSDVPGAAQSVITLSHPGPRRQAPDHYPTRVMMGILGGDFSSRINMNLREDKGWAYGAGAWIRYWPRAGSLRASASVRADATVAAVKELRTEVARMAGAGPDAAELQREKSGAIRSLPGLFATGTDALATIQDLAYFGLPLDDYTRFVPAVEAVTLESATNAARTHLHPEQLQALVVGDGATVLAGLRELLASGLLGDGELVLLDGDGKVLPASPSGPATHP
jgi:zinc protease